jgi:hypothetical protein
MTERIHLARTPEERRIARLADAGESQQAASNLLNRPRYQIAQTQSALDERERKGFTQPLKPGDSVRIRGLGGVYSGVVVRRLTQEEKQQLFLRVPTHKAEWYWVRTAAGKRGFFLRDSLERVEDEEHGRRHPAAS